MHRAISSFPNRKIYDGKLRDGPGMDVSLDDHLPGLSKVLEDIVAGSIFGEEAQTLFRTNVKDDDLRRQHVEVNGQRFPHPSTKSPAVTEHVDIFFTKIFPPLQVFLKAVGKSVNKEVMVICAYNHQVFSIRILLELVFTNNLLARLILGSIPCASRPRYISHGRRHSPRDDDRQ